MHRAEQIMDAVVTALTGLTTTGANVVRSRVYPQANTALPSLSISMGSDEPIPDDEENVVNAFVDSNLVVHVDIFVQDATMEQQLNEIRREITVALLTDHTLGLVFVHNTWEGETEEPEVGEGNKRSLTARMNWNVFYRRNRTDPGDP